MSKAKATVPFCWICSGKLNADGTQYTMVEGDDGHDHPVHKQCLTNEKRRREDELLAQYGPGHAR